MGRTLTWTKHQLNKLEHARQVIQDLEEYHPLTLRQIHYQLVGKAIIKNTRSEYTMLSTLLSQARIDGLIPWTVMEDRTRSYFDLTGYEDPGQFIKNELYYFLEGYKLDLLQDQDVYLELWTEKDALVSQFKAVAEKYTVPVVVCKGYQSTTFKNDFRDRAEAYAAAGRRPVISYWGDFDPTGLHIPQDIERVMKDVFNVLGFQVIRSGLLLEDIRKYRLPNNLNAVKDKDPRAKAYREKYGNIAVELDALSPPVLTANIERSIRDIIDVERYELMKAAQPEHVAKIRDLKNKVRSFVLSNIV